jgi:hypothetical protein
LTDGSSASSAAAPGPRQPVCGSPSVKHWLMARGGAPGMTVYDFWVLEAPELWTMGYRKCAPEHAPMMKRR